MSSTFKPIAELNNFIVLEEYNKTWEVSKEYQTEADLEKEFINDLIRQGYDYRTDLNNNAKLLENIRKHLQQLNDVQFSENDWKRFVAEYLNNVSDSSTDKAYKIQKNHKYAFNFEDNTFKNIMLVDKKNQARNKLEVINQFSQKGNSKNRYDVTILVNGIPLVQIELKKRGVALCEAFNQINRYRKESYNSENSLFKYLQIFVISNGTDTRYFSSTTKRENNSFIQTINWALANNEPIKDLKDFTETFFQPNCLLKILLTYSVFNTQNTLLILRPYQIAAVERILWKIISSHNSKTWSTPESGGFIWHTTGSGKTLTSFKAACLAKELDFVHKVLFVVDRKDLDVQTIREYEQFAKDSCMGSANTSSLKDNLNDPQNKIIVTTIQKLNNLMKSADSLEIYKKEVVFIFDECHRSQFGEAQKNLQKKFKKYYQFGFTGTPIFTENAISKSKTTASIFGAQLHSYLITDAIRDDKVLKFKVDYNDVRPTFKSIETEQDENILNTKETKSSFLHPNRISSITNYILDNFNIKTHRNNITKTGFNAMFAVSSIEAAKSYYEEFQKAQEVRAKNNPNYKKLTITTIFSFAANEEQNMMGDIIDEGFNTSLMNSTSKEFLSSVINDYNIQYKTNFSLDGNNFENYFKSVTEKVRNQEIDLVIVVGMLLTGFDTKTLNTLFVDKNLRYHGLIQAFSRTNRILDSTKPFGNIVTFRDLEKHTISAIELFGKHKDQINDTANILLEKSFNEYMYGSCNTKGLIDIICELKTKFPSPGKIYSDSDKKEFVKLFGDYLKATNILQNFDEYNILKQYQKINPSDNHSIVNFKEKHNVNDDTLNKILTMPPLLLERERADYTSVYHDFRAWRESLQKDSSNNANSSWDDVVFQVELLKTQEIDLDYIFLIVFDYNKENKSKKYIINEMTRIIRSSFNHRPKEALLVSFINHIDFSSIKDVSTIMEQFFHFAKKELVNEMNHLIEQEDLNIDEARSYITQSLKNHHATNQGVAFGRILKNLIPSDTKSIAKKNKTFDRISKFVEKFKGIEKY